METVTTLVEYEVKSGTSSKGDWKFYLFKDSNGTVFKTPFNNEHLGVQATGFLNQLARISYEVEQTKTGFQNNVITAIEAAPNGVGASVVPLAPATSPQPVNSGDRELRIHRQTAAKVAAQLLGYFEEEERNLDSFYVIADALVDYFQSGNPDGAPSANGQSAEALTAA